MAVAKYGLRVYRSGVELRSDGRKRERLPGGLRVLARPKPRCGFRGKVRAWSPASAKRLAFIAANVDLFFRSHITLTYRGQQASWETAGDRNRRFVTRCRHDLHRFLRALRQELGEYLWVREFQKRGVVHYHTLCEHEVPEKRAAEAWGCASGQLHDQAVLRHGVKVDAIRNQHGVRRYLGQYIGKEKQKELPQGIEGAGRWWGRSRGLKLALLEEFIWLDRADGYRRKVELGITRVLRRYIEKRFRRRYRGGAFIDHGGELAARLAAMAGELRARWGSSPGLIEKLEAYGWELLPEGVEYGTGAVVVGRDSSSNAAEEGRRDRREAGGDHSRTHQAELWPED